MVIRRLHGLHQTSDPRVDQHHGRRHGQGRKLPRPKRKDSTIATSGQRDNQRPQDIPPILPREIILWLESEVEMKNKSHPGNQVRPILATLMISRRASSESVSGVERAGLATGQSKESNKEVFLEVDFTVNR